MDYTTSCRDLDELHPYLKEKALELISECSKQGINVLITETYRSVERQDYLYAQGRTRPGSIVTNAKGSAMSSYHQWRLAFDVCNNKKGDEYNITILNKIGAIGMKLGLEWGGSWTGFKDTPHFQYTFGLSIADLKNGKKPPTTVSTNTSKGDVYKVTKTKVSLNGKEKEVNTILLDGNNYVKLQDLADNKLQVSYDAKKKMPIITCK